MKRKILYLVMVLAMLNFLLPVSTIAADGGNASGGKSPGASGDEPMLELDEPVRVISIVIDGNPSEWDPGEILVVDPGFDNLYGYWGEDLLEMSVTHDGGNLYFLIVLAEMGWTNLYIEIDADQSLGTGYNTDTDPNGWYMQPHGIGIDYAVAIDTGGAFGHLWSLNAGGYVSDLGTVPVAKGPWDGAHPGFIEVAVPLSAIGSPSAVDLFFDTYYFEPIDEAPNTGHATYTMGPAPPAVTTGAATSVDSTTATLNGNLTSLGGYGSADVSFGWDTSSHAADPSAYSNWTTPQTETTGAFSDGITSLTPLTPYYFCARAVANGVTVYGSELTFTTTELLELTVSTNAATDRTLTTATLNGTLNSIGTYAEAAVSFGWDTVSRADPTLYATWTAAQPLSAAGSFSDALGSLTEDTQYFYRARAVGNGETVYGDEVSFWTLGPDDWTFMVYLDGDNNLEDAAIDDLNEMEIAGSTADVNILALLDIYSVDGTDIYYVEQDATAAIVSTVVQSNTELNMADPVTLSNFVEWCITNYPADNYALVLWNHGSGWKLQEGGSLLKGVCWDDTSGEDYLTSQELAEALHTIEIISGETLDVIGFDACLMGMAEIFYLVAPYCDYSVASEELEPWDGWPYNTILSALVADSEVPPGMTPAVLASTIVTEYMIDYGAAGQETMSAVNSAEMIGASVGPDVDTLALALISVFEADPLVPADLESIYWARFNTEETFGDSSYIDLYHFCENLQAEFGQADAYGIYTAAGAVMTSVDTAVIAEDHGALHTNFYGMSIYFPMTVEGYWMNYGAILDFTADTNWDEFVEYFYIPAAAPAEPTWTLIATDLQDDQFVPGAGPDIQKIEGAVIADLVAFKVTTFDNLDFFDLDSYMCLDIDNNAATGYTGDPLIPDGFDYIAWVGTGFLSKDLEGRFPIKPEERAFKQGLFGELYEWDDGNGWFDYVDSFPVSTGANYFWYAIPANQLGNPVGCIGVVELIGTLATWDDLAPDQGYAVFCPFPTEGPDLVISAKTEAWDVTDVSYTVDFTVLNQGNALASAGHDVSLYIDGVLKAEKVEVPGALGPGASWSGSFSTPISLIGNRDEIRVCADHFGEVTELNENNNCLTNYFPAAEALADALALGKLWLAAQQRPDGAWGIWYPLALTGLAVLKFETQALEMMDPEHSLYDPLVSSPFDTDYLYHLEVAEGMNYIMANAHTMDIVGQNAGDPDTDWDGAGTDHPDGIGVLFYSPGDTWHQVYETSIALMAIASSTEPSRVVTTGPLTGWTYEEVVQGGIDYLAFAQTDLGYGRGGWDYQYQNNSGSRSDQSCSGWATLAFSYAEATPPHGFGLSVPGFVRSELEEWVSYIQNTSGSNWDGGAGYTDPWDWVNSLKTGNLLQMFAWLGDTPAEPRVQAAIDFLERHWDNPDNPDLAWRGRPANYHATYTIMKGLEPLFIDYIGYFDWYQDFTDVLLAEQNPDGSWPVHIWDDGTQILSTIFALLTLEKAVPDVIEGPDLAISEKWEEWVEVGGEITDDYTVHFIVRNKGNVTASAGHDVSLSVDGTLQQGETVEVTAALAPGETWTGSFTTPITLTDSADEIVVCADTNSEVAELNEDNNCRFNYWTEVAIEVEDADITACTTSSVDVWVRNFPLTVNGGTYGLGAYTVNVYYDQAQIEIVDISPGDAPFNEPIYAIYPDHVSVTQYSTTMPGPSGDVRIFDIEFHCLREGTSLFRPKVEVLANTYGDEFPAVGIDGLIRQIQLEAVTVLDQEQDAETDIVVLPTGIDRLINPITEATATGVSVGAYEATAYYSQYGIDMLDVLPGDAPFGAPAAFNIYSEYTNFADFDATGTEPPITFARLVPSLIGCSTDGYRLEVFYHLIAGTGGGGIPEFEPHSLTFQRGDVNENGSVNIIDAMKGAQYLVGLPEAGAINLLNMASVHHDGLDGDEKTIIDCMYIAQYVVGILNPFFE